jgi:methionyl-tRNA formyltransferase
VTSPGLKIAFAGTPDFAATILEALLSVHKVSLVYTQQDRPAGRGRQLQPSPVKQLAEKYKLPLKQPVNKLELQEDLSLEDMDVLVVAAYGMILPRVVLDRPRYGCINIHTSLLPRWRGAAPVQRAILAGDTQTGITIMQMDEGLDTGDILFQQTCQISPLDTSGTLFASLAQLGSDCLLKTLELITSQRLQPLKQPAEGITYAHKILKTEALIDWNTSASDIDRKIRAFNPAPIAYMMHADLAIRVWQAVILDRDIGNNRPGTILDYSPSGLDIAATDKVVRILKFQLPGKKVIDCRDFHNGHPTFWIPSRA